MPITLSLSGKVALITGGSRGIGAAAVRMFVAAGARVMFNYEKSKAQSERLVKELGKKNCAAIHCNLSGTGTAQELVEATVKRFGRLDILVTIHGVCAPCHICNLGGAGVGRYRHVCDRAAQPKN